jgi:hypothetical protein
MGMGELTSGFGDNMAMVTSIVVDVQVEGILSILFKPAQDV